MSSTAVALARDTLGDLSGLTVLVVGAGEAGRLTAAALAREGAGRMLVTSRTAARTADLAAALAAEPVAFEERGDAIAAADIVISSTAAPGFVIDAAMIERAMRGRPARPLLLIDIAVPRDIEPSVRDDAGRAPVRHRRAAGGGGAQHGPAARGGGAGGEDHRRGRRRSSATGCDRWRSCRRSRRCASGRRRCGRRKWSGRWRRRR